MKMELPRQQHADLGSAVKPEAAAAHFQGKMPARYATASKRLATQRDRKQENIPALLSPSLYRLYPSLSFYPYLPQPMHTQIHTYIHSYHSCIQTDSRNKIQDSTPHRHIPQLPNHPISTYAAPPQIWNKIQAILPTTAEIKTRTRKKISASRPGFHSGSLERLFIWKETNEIPSSLRQQTHFLHQACTAGHVADTETENS